MFEATVPMLEAIASRKAGATDRKGQPPDT